MSWADPGLIVGAVGGAAGIFAAIYAYLPYRAGRRSDSRHRFVEERRFLAEHRVALTQLALAADGSGQTRTAMTGMLTRAAWVPPNLMPLSNVRIALDLDTPPIDPANNPLLALAGRTLPWIEGRSRYRSYTAAMAELARPRLFQDLPCYRLLSADLGGSDSVISVGMTTFFAGVNESEALAHEFARSHVAKGAVQPAVGKTKLPMRSSLARTSHEARNTIFSVSALTFRVENASATFFLHSRDAAAVAIAGNVLHLAPSGVFQPTAEEEETVQRDSSPWLTLCREYAEEFLGVDEAQGDAGVALSYTEDEPYASINRAYTTERLKVFVCGLGIDPLTYCPELVTIACFEQQTYDDLFGHMVIRNSEGHFRGRALRGGKVVGYDFTHATVTSLLKSGRLSPAARAALTRAWDKRHSLGIA